MLEIQPGAAARASRGLVYLVIGVVVAATHHYLAHVQTAKAVLSAALAVILWPLILLGVNLHIH